MEQNTPIAQLEKTGQGHYLLKGQLNFQSVPELWHKNKTSLFDDDCNKLSIDLSQLQRSDSSGLAILVEWYREAEQCGKAITFFNLPKQMYDIARLSGLHEILPLAKK